MLKLSKFTVEVLKNFASINPNLVVSGGSTLSTIAEAKSILASVTIPENFPQTFGIYDLNEFISILSLMDEPELEFAEDSAILSSGNTSVKYRFANPSVLTTPSKAIKMPETDLSIRITADMIAKIRRAASVLGHSIFAIKSSPSGALSLVVYDAKDASANSFALGLTDPPLKNELRKEFSLEFLIDNLKLFPGNYTVDISSKLISKWVHSEFKLEYFIALEKTSTL